MLAATGPGVKMRTKLWHLSLMGCVWALAPARADVVISSAATQNETCSAGVCAPTAADAVLNIGDLETLLALGNLEVTTTGSGVQADNIDIDAALSWSTSNTLSLNAQQSINISKAVTVAGPGVLTLADNALSFWTKGRVVFQSFSSTLTINGANYTLVNSIQSMASAITANPSGTFALANDYDASGDGTYTASPVQKVFSGTLEGLGNTISHFSIAPPGAAFVGLFVFAAGTIENLNVLDAKIEVRDGSTAGVISSDSYYGHMRRVFVTGHMHGKGTFNAVGGLSGGGAAIEQCSADVQISDDGRTAAGGLVQGNGGSIDQSFATGSVYATGHRSLVGGLSSDNYGTVQDSYATGAVTASGAHSKAGGLVGTNNETNGIGATIKSSYSTGAVLGGPNSLVGGYAGRVFLPSRRYNKHDYWDTTTSGTDQGTGKGNEKGIIGLSTQALQSHLPKGFSQTIWAEDPKINNGLPYLIANPPR